MQPCFPDPATSDESPIRQGESQPSFLGRSTWYRAAEARRFLNTSLAALPPAAASRLCLNLRRDPWGSPLSELVVGLAMQGLGANPLRYEVPVASGKALDWRAEWPDGAVYVEVATPVINAAAQDETALNHDLAEVVRRAVPPGWRAWLFKLPPLGPNDRKAPLRKALAGVFAALPAHPPVGYQHEVDVPVAGGRLKMRLLPERDEGGPEIEMWPGVGFTHDAHLRIEDIVRDKRDQAKGADAPVLLAIRGGLLTDLDDYDRALFGLTVVRVGPGVSPHSPRFKPSGILATRGTGEPRISGVLAMPEMGIVRASEPVLYCHRRSTAPLPKALLALEQRVVSGTGILSIPASVSAFAGVEWARTVPDDLASTA